MAVKYKEYFQYMLKNNEELFGDFEKLHAEYEKSPEKMQKKFNEEGKKVMRVIREWEDKLCRASESSGYGTYSGKLAEKFQDEARKKFPKIDSIGLVVFEIKKIKLR